MIVRVTCDRAGHTGTAKRPAIRSELLARALARLVLDRTQVRQLWFVIGILGGCVPSRTATFGPVDHEVQRRTGLAVEWSEGDRTTAAIDALLARELDVDAAVRIAFARNRRLQARLDELGIAASQVASATVLPPATVDADYKRALSGSGSEMELTVVQDVLDLVQLGQRRGIADAELAAAQARAVAATIELAGEVEVAYDEVVAAEQGRGLAETAFATASASADLVERQHAAGNATDLALAREQEQRERARIDVGRADQARTERRARFAAMVGITGKPAWTTATRLPDPPAMLPALDDLLRAAATASLDAIALRADADAARARHRYALVRAFLPQLGLGAAVARRTGETWEAGPAIRIGIPLFDQQQGPRARAIAEERRARDELAATESELAATVQTTRSRVEQAFAEVRQLVDVVMPLRKRVLDETVLHYNAMNASTFELLAARREAVEVERQYIAALRAYWTAIAEAKTLRRGGRAMLDKERSP